LKNDIKIFEQIKSDLKLIPIEQDVKYDKLLTVIENLRKKKHQEKILIFSEYADTIDYLFMRLDKIYPATAKIHGQTSGNSEKILAFAPKSNDYDGEEKIDLMTATDVLSEGHNLQDCSSVINYDLHWNPVRLIQRAGRIDRIGSEADIIYIANFLPTDEVERVINLSKTLKRRIDEIHKYVGEDDRILSEDEKINDQAMYAIYQVKDMDEVEKTDEEFFSTDEAEIIIKNLLKEKPEYMALIKKMQLGLRSSKTGKNYKGSYAFFRSGDFPRLFIRKTDGNITDDFSEVLKEIKCDPKETEKKVSEDTVKKYYEDIQNLKDHFNSLLSEESTVIRVDPEVRRTQKRLRIIMSKKKEDNVFVENAAKIDKILNVFFPNHLISLLKRLNKQEQDDDRYFEELVNLYNNEGLGDIAEPGKESKKQPVDFICGEILI